MTSLDVSVVIPCYNAKSKLGRCLGALRRVTLPSDRFEILFVDDCSTDGTYEFLVEQAQAKSNWRILRLAANSGSPSAPRNLGLDNARGTFVFFLDADDELCADTLEVYLKHAQETQADVVRGALIAENGSQQTLMNQLPNWHNGLTLRERVAMIIGNQSTTPCALVRREVLIDHGIRWRSDIRMGEDTLFLIELLSRAPSVEYIDHPTYIYVKTASLTPSSTQSYGDRELRDHVLVWREAVHALAALHIDYVTLRLQIGLQTALRSMIFLNRGDISVSTFSDFARFLREHAVSIRALSLSQRLKELIAVAQTGDYAGFRKMCRPRLLIAGHDLKFITSIIGRLEQFYEVRLDEWKGHDSHDEEQSCKALEWAELIWCEWLLGNAVWYAKRCRKDQVLITRMHRFELSRDFGEHLAYENVNATVAVSTLFFERMLERFPTMPRSKARLLHNYVETEKYTRGGDPERRFRLGVIGILPARKRFDRALSLLAALRRHDPRYTLDVYGKVAQDLPWLAKQPEAIAYYNQCEAQIRDAGLVDAVRFRGHVDIPQALAEFQTGIIVSQSDSVRAFPCSESFHLAVADGFASGGVSLVQHWEGAEYVWPDRFILQDEDAMVDRILAYANNIDLYQRDAAIGHAFVVENYGVDRFVEGFRALFQQAV